MNLRLLGVGAALVLSHGDGFTLPQAQRAAQRYENRLDLGGVLAPCRWLDRRDAICPVTYDLTVIDGQPAQIITGEDVVTRSGPCSITGRIVSRKHGITVIRGRKPYGNCFTGPLIVEPKG
jgi:hypothetical protein